ncbi:MAG: CBS domain-containing protein [Planctomycetaceae bacterium]
MTDPSGEVQLRALLQSALVGQLTLKVRHQLAPDDEFGSAMALMRNRSHGCALVCQDGQLVGIVTERDILHGLHSGIEHDAALESVMTSQPVTVTSQDTLFDAIALMDDGGYRRLPVLDADGCPIGVVDVKTVTGFLVEHYAEAFHNQTSSAETTARHREGA